MSSSVPSPHVSLNETVTESALDATLPATSSARTTKVLLPSLNGTYATQVL
jgi:hypothetical protein